MDSINKSADFINSAVEAQTVTCPSCGTVNKATSKFCICCGNRLGATATESAPLTGPNTDPFKMDEPAPTPVKDPFKMDEPAPGPVTDPFKEDEPAPVDKLKPAPPIEVTEESAPAFASGLPSWDIVPPNVPVRRIHH